MDQHLEPEVRYHLMALRERNFSRIADAIAAIWGTNEALQYFHSIVIDTRGGRQGFPPEVFVHIMKLYNAHPHNVPENNLWIHNSYR
jgi:hypothetical protein